MTQPSLKSVTDEVLAFRDARDWRQFHTPKNLAAGISVESAELVELFLWSPSLPAEQVSRDGGLIEQVSDELADVLIYSLTLAADLKIDVLSAIRMKLQKNAVRYTVDEYRGSAEKAPHTPGASDK